MLCSCCYLSLSVYLMQVFKAGGGGGGLGKFLKFKGAAGKNCLSTDRRWEQQTFLSFLNSIFALAPSLINNEQSLIRREMWS